MMHFSKVDLAASKGNVSASHFCRFVVRDNTLFYWHFLGISGLGWERTTERLACL